MQAVSTTNDSTKKAVPTQVYARVVGYYRPVSKFNSGKRQEWSERSLTKVPQEIIFQ